MLRSTSARTRSLRVARA